MPSSLNRFTSLEKKPRHLLQGKKSNRFIRCLRSHPDMLRGFTLVELMVVLGVIAIIASVGGAAFNQQLPKYRLRGDTRSITSTLMLARMKATSTGLQYAVFFTLNSNPQVYRLQRGNLSTNSTVWSNESYSREISFGVNMASVEDDNGIQSSNARIIYFPSGKSGTGEIFIGNGVDQYQITLTSTTGRVRNTKL